MYAIVSVGGKQYKVEAGKYFTCEKINAEVGATVELPCLLIGGEGETKTGTPSLKEKAVCEVLEHGKESKIVVFKYKSKKNERKKQGHRQPYTKLKVVSIG